MFNSIKNWFKGVWNKMIGKAEIKKAFNVETAVSDVMRNNIQNWAAIYGNDSPWLNNDIKSMNLGAAVSNEMARLVTIEMESKIEGSARADFLNESYKKLLKDIRKQVEYGLSKGGLVFKPYVADDKIKFDYVQADYFFPIKFSDDGMVTEAVFLEQIKKGQDDYYNKLEYHKFENGAEYISNKAYHSKNSTELGKPIPLNTVQEWSTLVEEIQINNINKPLFAYFSNPMANTVEPGNPMGVSIFSRAVELIEEADRQWSRFIWENKSGERALFTDIAAWKKDEYGNSQLPDLRLYRTLESDDPLFHEWSPQLRNIELLDGLDAILKKIEFNCGLAYGTISDPQTEDKTATEVKQSKQRSYSTIADIQTALENALEHTVYIMDVLASLYKLAPMGTYETSHSWDDSIVADRETEFTEKNILVAQGILSKAEFRAWYTGETLEEAEKNLPKQEMTNFEE